MFGECAAYATKRKISPPQLFVPSLAGAYSFSCHTVDSVGLFEYHSQNGMLVLHANGGVSGGSVEQGNRGLPAFASSIQSGRWSKNELNFVYLYGTAPYDYNLRFQSIRQNGESMEVIFAGTWRAQARGDEPKNHGTVKSLVMIPLH